MFRPTKSLGQNFLVNKGIVAKIIAAAELSLNDTVLEAGPGMGALTEELLKYAGRVIAVEYDPQLYNLLREKFKNASNLELVNADILRFNFQFFSRAGGPPGRRPISNFQTNSKFQIPNFKDYKIVANIPYNITGKFFHKFLLAENRPRMIVVTVQKEVGERLMGKGTRSLLSLAAELYGNREKICDISPGSFNPPPKVASMVVRMVVSPSSILPPDPPSASPLPPDYRGKKGEEWRGMEQKIMRLARIGFVNKRKKLVTNLSTGLKISKEKILCAFKVAGIDDNARAEELNKDTWLNLAKILEI